MWTEACRASGPAAFVGRRDFEDAAVFCDSAARDGDALPGQAFDDRQIGKGVSRVFLFDQSLDLVLYRLV